ncbi:uncharacterized protein PFL1_03963 [Pseudozyma flocculosa PF-1]|uniref:YTH domain-containing protein n=1 Tax=Pseudozyma flocculosa PF-1 TaxID=1277687 RepID=A0A061H9F7_9BASI|nr:uncharacterized protein PFL1_03963 [Pseudozyma flocculosa PF-1]EPQ28660.1 hypothetical protein PFL1_03963 [Pseudozyma flocculosa PF-1]
MSVTPPPSTPPPPGTPGGTHSSPSKQSSSRWGTISGGALRSPPPAPSSGASVRRNHTIHGARQNDKPRLEKHFEQPENFEQLYGAGHATSSAAGHSSLGIDGDQRGSSSSSYVHHPSSDPLSSPPNSSGFADEPLTDLAPLQALYSKANVSRNNSLPTRHSSRLTSHMPASATQGRSSLFNSLSAITGGSDHDEHDWEKMIRAGGALGDDSKDSEEETLDALWTDTLFMHKRFPSAATSNQPRSPIAHSEHLFEGHHRSGSSSAMEAIEQGFSASSPLGPGFVRRHQSLNHHHGGRRLTTRSSDLLRQTTSTAAPAPSTSISAEIEQALSPRQPTLSMSAASSPIAPSSYSKTPWGHTGGHTIGSPSRFANSFPSPTEGRMADQQREQQQQRDASAPVHGRVASSSDSPSGSLMDIHASLAKLDIRGSFQPIPSDPADAHHGLPERPSLQSRSSSSDIQMQAGQQRKLPSLITNRDVLARGAGATPGQMGGPISAAAYVPPIGHAHSRQQSHEPGAGGRFENGPPLRLGPFTAAPTTGWQEKEQLFGGGGGGEGPAAPFRGNDQWGLGLSAGPPLAPPTPVDPTTLMLQKGYNPPPGTFDLCPPAARFFVIKSYTEDDVHKSLKYEIWASTDKGNQRLDKAFRESAHTGPIYLFFSVNASGHFCGMAQMLTPLDYTTSSNVWAQDGKWKGTFKVRWIYVKDLPNNQLRHIRLHNTPEVKPVTQSRDTQELTPDAGREVLRIMADYQAKTSLLQDFDFYEVQSQQQAAFKGQPAAKPAPHRGGSGSGPVIGEQQQHQQQQQQQPRRNNGASPSPATPSRLAKARPEHSPRVDVDVAPGLGPSPL